MKIIHISNFCRFPDCEEKKNDLCTPQIKLEHPSDWFRNQYITQINSEKIYAVLEKDWNVTHRLSKLSHMRSDQVQKLRDFKKIHKDDLYKKFQEFADQRKIYDKYPLSISRQISQGGWDIFYVKSHLWFLYWDL